MTLPRLCVCSQSRPCSEPGHRISVLLATGRAAVSFSIGKRSKGASMYFLNTQIAMNSVKFCSLVKWLVNRPNSHDDIFDRASSLYHPYKAAWLDFL